MGNSSSSSSSYSSSSSSYSSSLSYPDDPIRLSSEEDNTYYAVIHKYSSLTDNPANITTQDLIDMIRECDRYLILGNLAKDATIKILTDKHAYNEIEDGKNFYLKRIENVNSMKENCKNCISVLEKEKISQNSNDLSSDGLDQLKNDEGLRLETYYCTNGHLTVGYGHKVLHDDNLKLGDKITEQRANMWLINDVDNANSACRCIFSKWNQLSQTRKDVLINMAFQLGRGGLSGFQKMIQAIDNEEWSQAADEMLDSKWARSDSPRRASRLANKMRSNK